MWIVFMYAFCTATYCQDDIIEGPAVEVYESDGRVYARAQGGEVISCLGQLIVNTVVCSEPPTVDVLMRHGFE